MRQIKLTILTVLMMVLQVSFFGFLRPWGVIPNLDLIVLVLLAQRVPASDLITIAVIAGLGLDLLAAADFGLRTALYSVYALALLVVHQNGVDLDYLPIAILVLTGGVLFYDLALIASLIITSNFVLAEVLPAAMVILKDLSITSVCGLILTPMSSKLGFGPGLDYKPLSRRI